MITNDIKTYSLARDGNVKLSEHFTVKEFASHDGADTVLIDMLLIEYLEKIRQHFGKPIHINSGYRTPEHNSRVGGVKNSYHTKGRAADIVVQGVKSLDVARFAETFVCGGVGWYEAKSFTHIDTRPRHVLWKDSGSNVVTTFGSPAQTPAVRCPYSEPAKAVRYGAKGTDVKWLQWHLAKLGEKLKIDGVFGRLTKVAVLSFQKKHKLLPDGIVGPKTKAALKKAVD